MFEFKNKLKPLTEEEKSQVKEFFATWDQCGLGKWRIWYMYWRMRFAGDFIPEAEAILERKAVLSMESYKNMKEAEILQGLHAYENERQESGAYEVVRINDWADGRSLVISIVEYADKKVLKFHTVEILESKNPEYFRECMMRYAPQQALSNDKPF